MNCDIYHIYLKLHTTMSFDLLIFVKHDVDVVMYMWFNLTLLTAVVFASDGQSNVNEDSWQERWVRIKPAATRSSPKQIIGMGKTDGTLGTDGETIPRTSGFQMDGKSNWKWKQRAVLFICRKVGVFCSFKFEGRGFFLSLQCIVQTKIGSDKTDGNSKSLAY